MLWPSQCFQVLKIIYQFHINFRLLFEKSFSLASETSGSVLLSLRYSCVFPWEKKGGCPSPKEKQRDPGELGRENGDKTAPPGGGGLDRSCSEARKGGSLLEVSGGHTRRPKLQQLREAGRVYVWQGSVGTFFFQRSQHSCYSLQIPYSVPALECLGSHVSWERE